MIRPYAESDLTDVLEVWYQASLAGHPFLSRGFLDAERQQVAERWLPLTETSVFEEEGRVVAFVAMVGNEVGGLFVAPDRHRRGIGRRLLDHVRASRQVLELAVFEANTGARAFYEAYGFEVVGRRLSDAEGHPELRLRLVTGAPA